MESVPLSLYKSTYRHLFLLVIWFLFFSRSLCWTKYIRSRQEDGWDTVALLLVRHNREAAHVKHCVDGSLISVPMYGMHFLISSAGISKIDTVHLIMRYPFAQSHAANGSCVKKTKE